MHHHGSARRFRLMRPNQRNLPIADADRRTAMLPRLLPRAVEPRAIHVSGYDREGRDFYTTPAWVTEALLQHVQFRGSVWEPCCGDGAMSTVLAARGYRVISTDIAERGFGSPGIDFLNCRHMPKECRTIVTNPPYGDTGSHKGQARSSVAMLNFMRHSLALVASVQGQLALLVRLQWIAGRRAADLLSTVPFAATIVLTRRIQWFDKGEHTNHAQHHHAWVVVDHAHPTGSPPALLYA
jgi:predicted RNA methylase